MLTHDEARNLALTEAGQCPVPVAIIDSATIHAEWGWAFFYQSVAYLTTGDVSEQLGGNGPILVDRQSGRVFPTESARTVESSIANYLDTGDPTRTLDGRVLIAAQPDLPDPHASAAYLHGATGTPRSAALKGLLGLGNGRDYVVDGGSALAAKDLANTLSAMGYRTSVLTRPA